MKKNRDRYESPPPPKPQKFTGYAVRVPPLNPEDEKVNDHVNHLKGQMEIRVLRDIERGDSDSGTPVVHARPQKDSYGKSLRKQASNCEPHRGAKQCGYGSGKWDVD